jgi:hypothetical protein
MIKNILLFIILSISVDSGFSFGLLPNIDNKLYNLQKTNNINKLLFKTNLDNNKNISIKLEKYKPLYKIIYKLELLTTIRFKTLVIIFIFLRTIYSFYNNINDIVNIINIIDEKDIKEINKILHLLNFINIINIFNIISFLEFYELIDQIIFINKKSLLYIKYFKLYKKDCFIINYI